MKFSSRFFLPLLLMLTASSPLRGGAIYPLGIADDKIMAKAYQGDEKLIFRVSWSGGIKIGELFMEINRLEDKTERFEIKVSVKDSGMFHFFYPVSDTFVTIVEGAQRLPVSYEVNQKEGRSYRARRYSEYDQEKGEVRYRKNDQEPVVCQTEGGVHNEFSSFFFTRILKLDSGDSVIVPTFADGKRHQVVVRTGELTRLKGTVRGDVNVIPVTPIMKFKGLYNKDGDTVIWFTDDDCRVPVRINSKILIGSLTAELVSYENPLCPDLPEYHSKNLESVLQQPEFELGD
ncbi:MAG TPA: DUF3108 domain-containing protein [Desulfobacterales bacterium]|nr:DUF3108 domain-containing protein [Desulfobacterales bacterium]